MTDDATSLIECPVCDFEMEVADPTMNRPVHVECSTCCAELVVSVEMDEDGHVDLYVDMKHPGKGSDDED